MTIHENVPRLPIAEQAELREALSVADLATLVMVLTQLSEDLTVLDRFAQYLGSPWNPSIPAIPEEARRELEDAIFAHLTQSPPPAGASRLPSPDVMHKMMEVNVGEPVADEFIGLLYEQMGFDKPAPLKTKAGRKAPPAGFKVAVIGAGLTGMLAGIKLDEAGYDFEIIEKNAEIGGTWLENIYPGVAVDTPSHFYSYSFEQNPDWTHYIPMGAEVQAYLLRIAEKYNLRPRIRFSTRVTECVFDDGTGKWTVTIEGPEGRSTIVANAVINCHGPLNRWSLPKIPGLPDFKGPVMHTAGWNPKVDLKGKRVALIGTGASAAQVGPAIAPEVEHLTVFQRSRHWCLPYQRTPVPEGVRWALRRIPYYSEWFRFRTYWFTSDGLYADSQVDPEWPQDVSVSARNEAVRGYCLWNLHTKLEDRPDLIEKLTPDYPVFGKRIVMDVDWLNCLKRENVTLEDGGIDHVAADAIVMKDGRAIPLDAIVCATGFEIARMVGKMKIIGRGGRNLGEEWGEDDPRGYLGVTVPGFPNFFLTVGPSSGPAHAAGVNLIVESQIHYIIECLDTLVARNAATMEPTQSATDAFNADVERVMSGMVWSHPKALSYHKNSKGRVILASPYRLVDYWTMTRAPKIEDYSIQ
jgi:4-hydroxyacetophenone monooxygenase